MQHQQAASASASVSLSPPPRPQRPRNTRYSPFSFFGFLKQRQRKKKEKRNCKNGKTLEASTYSAPLLSAWTTKAQLTRFCQPYTLFGGGSASSAYFTLQRSQANTHTQKSKNEVCFLPKLSLSAQPVTTQLTLHTHTHTNANERSGSASNTLASPHQQPCWCVGAGGGGGGGVEDTPNGRRRGPRREGERGATREGESEAPLNV